MRSPDFHHDFGALRVERTGGREPREKLLQRVQVHANGPEQFSVFRYRRGQKRRKSQLQRALAVSPRLQLARGWIGAGFQRGAECRRPSDTPSNRFVERGFARCPLVHQTSTDENTAESAIADGKWRRKIHQLVDHARSVGELMMFRWQHGGNHQRSLQVRLLAAHDT